MATLTLLNVLESESFPISLVDIGGGVYALAVANQAEGDAGPVDLTKIGGTAITLGANGGLKVDFALAGCSFNKNIDVDESEDAIKATSGILYGYIINNLHATAYRYVKFYNAAVADVTVGTTVPDLTIPVPPLGMANISIPQGLEFTVAISIAATTGIADNDTGAPGANEVVVTTWYK